MKKPRKNPEPVMGFVLSKWRGNVSAELLHRVASLETIDDRDRHLVVATAMMPPKHCKVVEALMLLDEVAHEQRWKRVLESLFECGVRAQLGYKHDDVKLLDIIAALKHTEKNVWCSQIFSDRLTPLGQVNDATSGKCYPLTPECCRALGTITDMYTMYQTSMGLGHLFPVVFWLGKETSQPK
jgi:hypothetical protein